MIILLKMIACSSLLLAVYYWFLQKEKMHQFNRFYLLFSLILSCTVPFISIKSENPKPIGRLQTTIDATQKVLDLTPKQESFNWINLVWVIYGIVTLIFLTKFIVSIIKIKNLKGEKIVYQNHHVLIMKENISPFSFLNTIYLSNNYLINNKIDSRIFLHEKSHLEQKHSIDLLFIEILKAFTWFNPSIYFYKKAIVTNHEFLADESVLKNDFNVKDYQKLILAEIISTQNYNLTHTFNFKNTKKRFIMMNTKKSKLTTVKKAISIPILLLAFGLFVQKTYANTIEKIIKETKEKVSKSEKEPIIENNEDSFKIKKEEYLQMIKQSKDTVKEEVKDVAIYPVKPNNTEITQNSETVIVNPVEKEEYTFLPQYPGGINEMRNKMSKLFDGSKINSGRNKEIYRTELNYTITEEGNITDIKAAGNNDIFNEEAIASLKKANENIVWRPAEKDGKPVRYKMRIPLTMSFQ
ncbi:M56 family metallopeptidase [Chryseobacterium sp. MMS23-Vi53]|uniref:M56 family metallopeptidase n=1 Tax=Chryseobacterium sp. MMS23-Vi53 TaxID=3386644 RepID=UPI0039E8BA87